MEETKNTQIGNEKKQGWRTGLVIGAGIVSIVYAQMICPYAYIVPLLPHMYEYWDTMPNDIAGILLFMTKWMTNSIATLPCYAIGQVYSITFLFEIIFMIVGACSKKTEKKGKMTKAILVTMLIKIILAYLFTALEFIIGMSFLIFPDMNNMVSYQHWPLLCSIVALMMFFGATTVTVIYLVLKLSKK